MARSVDHKEGLIKNRCYIVKNLANADDVAEYLYLENFFTEEMRDKVQRKREREKKNRKILDELQYRGKHAVKGLHVAFLNTENEELAEKLAPYVEVLDSEEHKIEPKRWPPSVEEQIQMEQDSVIKVRHVTGIYRHHYNDSDKVYKMKNRLRGKVFVINNVNFKKSCQRLGSDKDAQNIKSLFTELHFDVIRKDNCTKQDMLNFLTEERDKVTWSDMECLILIIMSHGTDKGVLGVDEEVLELKQMTDLFNSDNCPGLNEKPRLVFVQACRGDKVEALSSGTAGIQVSDGEVTNSLKDLGLSDNNVSDAKATNIPQPAKTIHSAADFLIAFATPEGTPAYRHIHIGSWFLAAMIWTFKYHSYHEDLLSMLTKVNAMVAKGQTLKGNVTVSEISHKLTKKFYFFPGIYDDPPKLLEN